jgi:hypothetical protein
MEIPGQFSVEIDSRWVVAELKVTSHCFLAGRERERVSQPSVRGTVFPMMPTILLLDVALRDGDLEWLGVSA